MTKREMFLKAHKIARETLAVVGDYRIAFTFALKGLYHDVESKLIEMGLKVWEKGGHKRIYLNAYRGVREFLNLHIERYKTGNICTSEYEGESFAHGKAAILLDSLGRSYYDCHKEKFVWERESLSCSPLKDIHAKFEAL